MHPWLFADYAALRTAMTITAPTTPSWIFQWPNGQAILCNAETEAEVWAVFLSNPAPEEVTKAKREGCEVFRLDAD